VRRSIRWTPAAAQDLEAINDYLQQNHPQYRHPTMRKIFAAVQTLKEWPQRGRMGREEGTREFILSPLPYIVVYRPRDPDVEVLRIYHGVRQRP